MKSISTAMKNEEFQTVEANGEEEEGERVRGKEEYEKRKSRRRQLFF